MALLHLVLHLFSALTAADDKVCVLLDEVADDVDLAGRMGAEEQQMACGRNLV